MSKKQQTIQERIAALRAAYAAEQKKIREHYDPLVAKCRDAVTAAEKFDYTAVYKEAYRSVLTEMEGVITQYRKILERTPYVEDTLPAIIKKLAPTPIETGKVEDRFAALMQECLGIADWLDGREVTEQLKAIGEL